MAIALITGGARRVGAHLSRHLAAAGWELCLHYHGSAEEAKVIAGESARPCHLLQADLGTAGGRKALQDQTVAALAGRPLDLLIHNASIFPHARLEATTEAAFDQLFALHVKAPLFLSRELAPHMRRSADALIVTLLDAGADLNWPGYFAYSLSKQSLGNLTIALAREFAPDIRVNGIEPGFILPPVSAPESYRQAEARRLSRDPGSPEAIALALDYLVGNRFLTGEILHVDGGRRWLRP